MVIFATIDAYCFHRFIIIIVSAVSIIVMLVTLTIIVLMLQLRCEAQTRRAATGATSPILYDEEYYGFEVV